MSGEGCSDAAITPLISPPRSELEQGVEEQGQKAAVRGAAAAEGQINTSLTLKPSSSQELLIFIHHMEL